jgi:hypothetical protein
MSFRYSLAIIWGRITVWIANKITCGAFDGWRKNYEEADRKYMDQLRMNTLLKSECEEWKNQALYHNKQHGLLVEKIRTLES